jgi:two-component system, OmpR family, sensor histidine kinase KdpD
MRTPDEILESIKKNESKTTQGRLKIFIGMCAGVGKTYSMLLHARDLAAAGHRVLIGYIETHGRQETEALLAGLEVLPRKKISYRDRVFEEFDLEKALAFKPDYIVLDELAHTNIPDSRYLKRYQDAVELLENGINVLTTLNVQHVESRSKTVEQITGAPVYETVPDSIIDLSEDIELIDLPIEELLQRLSDGKVYLPAKAELAARNFFKTGNLISLREMALRLTAEKVEEDLIDYMSEMNIVGPWKAGDKLMVAVGASPFSADLIKWTRRMAFSLKAPWYAVYVNTNTKNIDKSSVQLESNLRLAKELGAEVITTAHTDLVEGLLQVARTRNIAQIIIGKPLRYSILNYITRNNYIDRLIHESGNIDIYIVRPSNVKAETVKKHRSFQFTTGIRDYILASISVLIIGALCFPFKEWIGYQSVGLILLFNILLMPFYINRGAILWGALFNSLVWNFFFIPPLFTIEIGKTHDLLTLALSIVIAITTGMLASRIRAQKTLVQDRERNALALLDFSRELARSVNKAEALNTAIKHIENNFQAAVVFLNTNMEATSANIELRRIITNEAPIAKWSMETNKIAGRYTPNLPHAMATYYPVVSGETKLGVICVITETKLSIEYESLLMSIISQFATFYKKEETGERLKQMQMDAETKKLYDTLFDSISHEFRTPIAVITGSATCLQDNNIKNKPQLVDNFANEIYIASKRLNILVENLLDISRIDTGQLKLKINVRNLNDIISDTVSQLAEESFGKKVELEFENGELEVEVDYGLVLQALYNLLHNSLIHTPEGSLITVKTERRDKWAYVTITDNGYGIKEEDIKRIFERFYRPQGSKPGGAGLGLSIALGFIRAHNGELAVRSNLPSGLVFEIKLPLYDKER